uniref:Uncharacterized protein n=1 Tax=Panagrolaimus sp. ES5 TaxID=591445 RepID=A0AC34F3I5_9BILA
MINTTLDTVTIFTNEQQKLIFGFIWWELLLLILFGISSLMVLFCVILLSIKKTQKTSNLYYPAASEMPSNILIHPSKAKINENSSMKVKLLGKRDIQSTVQDQHFPISTKKRSNWEHSLDYSNPYNPKRPYCPESNYSA